ncbi:hypothetical protein CFIMG_000250RA [Ceratocystis fimbriata CBS 114723]|uniref:COX assembly mitochondrial protein n=1 Tax=Ceratocystis fimbriata CBS 114723 TaxID=1035309 RepID=A0A2C5XIY3_9PEZI|nr:hypothetical protein CFIMG_000250RA [Ceratocystis fimbriata CBS 114723]
MADRNSDTGAQAPRRAAMPSRNPLPLSASQEAQVQEVYRERVRRHCAAEIKAFAECARGRTFSIPFTCADPHRVMNACMKTHATPSEMDAAREEWFAKRLERAEARAKKAVKAAEQEAFVREWWGLPQKDTEERRRMLAKLEEQEKVGGKAAPNRPRVEDQ